jgi:hypothetical protein
MTEPKKPSTHTPFSPEEIQTIQRVMREGATKIPCPRCGAPLASGMPVAGGGTVGFFWLLRCDACQRGLTARDLPRG